MIKFKNLRVAKLIILSIVLLLVQGDSLIYGTQENPNIDFEKAKKEYISGDYVKTKIILDKILDYINNDFKELRGKIYLLLGAVFERSGNSDKAIVTYLLGKMLLEKPVVEGVDLSNLPLFRENVSEDSDRRKVIEKTGVAKEKKKFPVLIAIGGVIAAAVLIYFFNKVIKTKSDGSDPSGQLAKEIYDSIEWVTIPAGEFKMGDNFNEGESDELPVHTVYLDSYKISKYEIAFDQYDKYRRALKLNNTSDLGWGRGNRPVIYVRYNEAVSFCVWLNKNIGKNISLPTEAQWEKAARGTDQRRYPWGNTSPDCSICNYQNCNDRTMPVGTYPSDISYYGVYDMAGNVSEMCSDWYSPEYYSVSPEINPGGPDHQFSGSSHVIRGGNWSSTDVRSADRSVITSFFARENNIGFRIVMID